MLGASAKAQANRHLATGSYGNGGGAGNSNNSSSANTNNKNSGTRKGSQPQSAPRDKAAGRQPKPALKAEGIYLKNKEKQPQGKKAHFDLEAYESKCRGGSPGPRLPFALLRVHKTQRATSMVEMTRRRCERPGSGVDPPRRLRSMAPGSPSPTLQLRLLLSATSPRPSKFSSRGGRRTYGEGSLSTRGFLALGLESFSRAVARRMEAHHRPPHHQQAMPEALYENGDAKAPTVHRQAQRPLRFL
jgi:hypothetical protein